MFGLLDRAARRGLLLRVRGILFGGTSGLAFLAAHVDPEPALRHLAQPPSAIVRRVLSLEQDAELILELGGVGT